VILKNHAKYLFFVLPISIQVIISGLEKLIIMILSPIGGLFILLGLGASYRGRKLYQLRKETLEE